MNYQDIINMIEMTKEQHMDAVHEKRQLRKNFKKYGWYDEPLAEDLCAREANLHEAINVLIARLLPALAELA